jgi:ABC-type branched-subunit amino acid transport system ATPase component
MTSMLELRDVGVSFGGLRALDGVNFALGRGETLALVGPNGAGKSTLVQIISGFQRPGAGRVLLEGRDVTGAPPEALAALGVARTFQTSRVFPTLSVFDSVMVGAQPALLGVTRGESRGGAALKAVAHALVAPFRRRDPRLRALEDKAEAVLKLFGERLWPRRDEPAFSLSYANRRRLEIARALLAEPRLLLLDEPTAGMNPTETTELTEVIADLQRARPDLAILLIEHKLDVVRRLARRVVVLNQGQVIADETPQAALSDSRVIEAYLGHGRGAQAEAAHVV